MWLNADFAESKLGLFFDRARARQKPIAVTLNATAYYNGIVFTIFESMNQLLQTKNTDFSNTDRRLIQVSNQLAIGACIVTYLKLRALCSHRVP